MAKNNLSTVPFVLSGLLLITAGCASTSTVPSREFSPQITDGVTGAQVTLDDIKPLLAAARHIYVSEEHTSQPDHHVQLRVLKAIAALGQEIVLGVEWLPHTSQGALSQWQAEPLSKENFLALVDWKNIWGFDIELYWPILKWAHQNRVPIAALNAPSGLVFGYSKHGRAGLTAEDRQMLPPLDSGNPAHRAYFIDKMRAAAQSMEGANHHTGFEEHIDAYYEAQLIWDETMAREVNSLLLAPEYQLHTIVVLAGRGHVDFGFGIPERVLALSKHDYVTIAPATSTHPPTTEEEEQKKGRPIARAHLFWWAD